MLTNRERYASGMGEMAGLPMICAPSPRHSSVSAPLDRFQMLWLVPVEETKIRKSGPSRGENVVAGVSARRTGEERTGVEALVSIRQRVLLGLARVITRRLPSAAAASDVYRSGPEVSR